MSNAYNRPDQLSTELRSRILLAASELGYSGPDPVARSLRTKQADAVGLIFSERLGYAFRDPGAVEFLHGLAEACTERRRSLLMIPAAPDAAQLDTVLRAAVDGFVVSSVAIDDPLLAGVLSRAQPAVIVDSPREVAGVGFVGIDDRAGFAAAARHVLAHGHRRIGVLAVRRFEDVAAEPVPSPLAARMALGTLQHPVRRLRLAGLADALAEAAVLAAGAQAWISERGSNSRDEGTAGANELLDSVPGLTAIMCTSDILALGVLDALAARGIRPGVEVTVTGFDDVPAAAVAGLTTVRQPLEGKGRAAIELLLGDGPAASVQLPTQLVVRSSSGSVH